MTATGAAAPVSARDWARGARPRTLPAAIVPVLAGSGVAFGYGRFSWWRALLALVVALGMQVGVNYANDYSDGVRGTDTERVGPARLVAGGLARPRQVLAAAGVSFGVACAAGLVLAAVTSWWLVLAGAVAVLAAFAYTGGPIPYGYRGLGELAVFVFFGVVAVAGTAYTQVGHIPGLAWAAAIPVGLLACALLMINNLRDIPTDTAAGKRTLAVILGDDHARSLYGACVLIPFGVALVLAPWRPLALIAMLALPLAVTPVREVQAGARGPELIRSLARTGRLQLVFGLLLAVGLAVSP